MSTFVRGLWGEPGDVDRAFSRLENKIYGDMARTRHRGYQTEPCVYFAFGLKNAEILERLGLPFTLLSEDPFVNWNNNPGPRDEPLEMPIPDETRPRNEKLWRREWNAQRSRCVWGLSHWHHKLRIIHHALQSHPEVCWLDWDTYALRRVPRSFWHRLRRGRSLQVQLQHYPDAKDTSRRLRRGPRWNRFLPHGGFIYCRSIRVIEFAIEKHIRRFPRCTDEVPLAHAVDKMMGGWKGPDAHYDMGFAPYCFLTRRTHRRPIPHEAIFVNGCERQHRAILRGDLSGVKLPRYQRGLNLYSTPPVTPAVPEPSPAVPPTQRRNRGYQTYLQKVAERAAQKAALLPPTRKIRLLRFHIINGEKFERGAIAKVRPETAEWIIQKGFAEAA